MAAKIHFLDYTVDYHFLKKTGLIAGTTAILVSSISLVFGNFVVLWEDVEPWVIIGKNIFLETEKLNESVIAYKTSSYLWDLEIHSSCPNISTYIDQKNSLAFFKVTFTDPSCKNPSIYLKNKKKIILNSEVKLNIVSQADLYNILLDLSSEDLEKMKEKYEKSASKNQLYKDYAFDWIPESLSFALKARQYKEDIFKTEFIDAILEKRAEKYAIPVVGYKLPKEKTKVPDAGRPYRSHTTDGIHHSWDIDTPFGEQVVALDDGIIVRIVDDWTWDSLSNLRYGELTYEDKLRNLDIYRGNQVWLKTMKWEVIMYGHLDTVMSNLSEGMIVKKWFPLWTVWITGVPQADYSDYHLDFSIHENPYNADTAGTYDLDDYMTWPRKLKGKSYDYIIEHQYDYFE